MQVLLSQGRRAGRLRARLEMAPRACGGITRVTRSGSLSPSPARPPPFLARGSHTRAGQSRARLVARASVLAPGAHIRKNGSKCLVIALAPGNVARHTSAAQAGARLGSARRRRTSQPPVLLCVQGPHAGPAGGRLAPAWRPVGPDSDCAQESLRGGARGWGGPGRWSAEFATIPPNLSTSPPATPSALALQSQVRALTRIRSR